MILNDISNGIKFLTGFVVHPKDPYFNIQEELIPLEDKGDSKIRIKIITPEPKPKKEFPSVLILHGMNKMGIDDPRMIHLAKCVSSLGYRAILPEIPEVMNLEITTNTLEAIYGTIKSVINYEKFRDERFGFLSISFSGGMGLIAISRPDIRNKFQAVCTIGAYSDFSKAVPYALGNYNLDNYGTYIFFYNYIDFFQEKGANLKIYFYEAAMDNGLKRMGSSSIGQKIFQILSESEKDFCRQIETKTEFRHELFEKFMKKSKSLIDSLSPINYVDKLTSQICLIHGKGDIVVPESESVRLAEKLKSYQKPYKLQVTKLLAHGDTIPIWKQIPEVPKLASAFGYFFSNI